MYQYNQAPMQEDMMYAQGGGNQMPSPMMSPSSGFPSGQGSSMTYPQMNPPRPFQNYNLTQAQYAGGGSVAPQMAQAVQGMGQGRDNVLAYINPHEAAMLARTQGGDINPYTGLPQFGLYDDMRSYA